QLKQEVSDIKMKLDELVEAAKIEGSDENEILYECLTKNKDGEAGNSFVNRAIKAELKEYNKDTDEYKLLNNVEKIMSNRKNSNNNKKIKKKKKHTKNKDDEK